MAVSCDIFREVTSSWRQGFAHETFQLMPCSLSLPEKFIFTWTATHSPGRESRQAVKVRLGLFHACQPFQANLGVESRKNMVFGIRWISVWLCCLIAV